jgi:hypothetical protein
MIKINAAARLKATQTRAASPEMKPELDKVMQAMVRAFGSKYKSESRDGLEEVYWEISAGNNGRAGPDYVLVAIEYNPKDNSMKAIVEGDELDFDSTSYTKAKDLLGDLRNAIRSGNLKYMNEAEKELAKKAVQLRA